MEENNPRPQAIPIDTIALIGPPGAYCYPRRHQKRYKCIQ